MGWWSVGRTHREMGVCAVLLWAGLDCDQRYMNTLDLKGWRAVSGSVMCDHTARTAASCERGVENHCTVPTKLAQIMYRAYAFR